MVATLIVFVLSTILTFVANPFVTNIIPAIDHMFIYTFHLFAIYVSHRACRLSHNRSFVSYLVHKIVLFLTLIMTFLVDNIWFWVVTISDTIPVSDKIQKMVIVYVQNAALVYLCVAAAIFRMKTLREKLRHRTAFSYEMHDTSSAGKAGRGKRKLLKDMTRSLVQVERTVTQSHPLSQENTGSTLKSPAVLSTLSPLGPLSPTSPQGGHVPVQAQQFKQRSRPEGPWNPYVIGLTRGPREYHSTERRSSASRESSPRSSTNPTLTTIQTTTTTATITHTGTLKHGQTLTVPQTPSSPLAIPMPTPALPIQVETLPIHNPTQVAQLAQLAQHHLIAIPGGGDGLRALKSKPACVVRWNTTGSAFSRTKRNVPKSKRESTPKIRKGPGFYNERRLEVEGERSDGGSVSPSWVSVLSDSDGTEEDRDKASRASPSPVPTCRNPAPDDIKPEHTSDSDEPPASAVDLDTLERQRKEAEAQELAHYLDTGLNDHPLFWNKSVNRR